MDTVTKSNPTDNKYSTNEHDSSLYLFTKGARKVLYFAPPIEKESAKSSSSYNSFLSLFKINDINSTYDEFFNMLPDIESRFTSLEVKLKKYYDFCSCSDYAMPGALKLLAECISYLKSLYKPLFSDLIFALNFVYEKIVIYFYKTVQPPINNETIFKENSDRINYVRIAEENFAELIKPIKLYAQNEFGAPLEHSYKYSYKYSYDYHLDSYRNSYDESAKISFITDLKFISDVINSFINFWTNSHQSFDSLSPAQRNLLFKMEYSSDYNSLGISSLTQLDHYLLIPNLFKKKIIEDLPENYSYNAEYYKKLLAGTYELTYKESIESVIFNLPSSDSIVYNPDKIFAFDTFEELLLLFFDMLLNDDLIIRKCVFPDCNRYFATSDKKIKYCAIHRGSNKNRQTTHRAKSSAMEDVPDEFEKIINKNYNRLRKYDFDHKNEKALISSHNDFLYRLGNFKKQAKKQAENTTLDLASFEKIIYTLLKENNLPLPARKKK